MEAIESERMQRVNFVMDQMHNSLNNIYEHVVDNERDELKKEVNSLIKQLKNVIDSSNDEV